MCDPRVLRYLAEQVLAVDQLQPPSKQSVEVELALCKFYLLPVGHPPDEVFRGMPASRAETLGDAIQRARPGDHEVGLLEIEQSRIVEVDRITEAPSPQRLSLDRGAQNALVTVGIVLLWGLWVTGAMPGFWLVLVIVTVPLANLAIRRTVEHLLRWTPIVRQPEPRFKV
jgi:hypothetical protein